MARPITATDDFGRRTVFTGDRLVSESTDSEAGTKPQWLEVIVWRTESGNFVVQRTTHYRIRHIRELCPRAEGYDLVDATDLDTYPCPSCNKYNNLESRGYAQSSRISVDVYHDPQELIHSFQIDGRYSNLAKTILADLSEQDTRVDDLWNTVQVP
jgi:hypothetical protein